MTHHNSQIVQARSALLTPFTNVLWVNGNVSTFAIQTGSQAYPFKTITQALQGLPNRGVSSVMRRGVDRINIANTPGYDEDLAIVLTNRNLELVGNFSLGLFDAVRWGPDAVAPSLTPRRNISVTGDLNGVDEIEVSLVIASDTLLEDTIDFTASQYHGPRISGKIDFNMTNSADPTIRTWLVMLQGRFYGTTGNTAGTSVEDMNLTDGTQALNLQLARFRAEGKVILGNNGRLEDVNVSRLNADIRAGFVARAMQTRFRGNWDLQNATSGLGDPVNGFYDCEFPPGAWTWAGPHDFFVDGTSNFFAKEGPVSFISNSAGGPVAASIVQEDLTPAT